MALLDPLGPIAMNVGTTDWRRGHCDEMLLYPARDDYAAEIVFRSPRAQGLSRYPAQ